MMDGRNWKKCPVGHVLGEIVREAVIHNGRRHYATRLHLFRQAVSESYAEVIPVDVIAVIEGTAPEIDCSLCKAKVAWIIGQAETARLVERWMKRQRVAA